MPTMPSSASSTKQASDSPSQPACSETKAARSTRQTHPHAARSSRSGFGHPQSTTARRLVLADDEGLRVRGTVLVGPAGAALARGCTRDRKDGRAPGLVEPAGARYLGSVMPAAVDFAHHERLQGCGTVAVVPAGAALARRCA